MSRPRPLVLLVAPVVAVVLGGCTVGDGTEPDPSLAGLPQPTAVASEQPALTPQQVSDRLLDAGEDLVAREPLATVTADLPVAPGTATVTLDVLAVEATATGTLVQLQVSTPDTVRSTSTTFSAEEFVDPSFVTDMSLVDPVAGQALTPVQAAEGGRWCGCSVIPAVIDVTPTPLAATFGALDPTTGTVDLRFGLFPVVEDLPVSRG